MPPFRCELGLPSLLDLVPASDRDAADALARGQEPLVLNPRRWLQASSDLPTALNGRLIVDESLRDRVGYEHGARVEGVPRGLAPVGPEGRLWVEGLGVNVLQPYEIDPNVADAITRMASGSLAPRDLPAPLLATLLLSQIVVPHASASAMNEEERLRAMRDSLARDACLVIRNAVSPLFVAALRRHFRALRRAGYLEPDDRHVVHRRDGFYCEFTSLYVQDQLGRYLNRLLPKPVKPSYTFFFRYHSSAALSPHRDRPQCRWNLSFAVDGEPDVGREGAWPIHFKTEEGETRSAHLGLGDAVLYSGTDVVHWREALLEGRTASLCFLHYVDADFEGSLG